MSTLQHKIRADDFFGTARFTVTSSLEEVECATQWDVSVANTDPQWLNKAIASNEDRLSRAIEMGGAGNLWCWTKRP